MVKIKGAKSKRKSSKQRHKIERKKREHKRDLKKAAKALKKNGLGPKRSKKSRDMAKLALKVSNTHPDKEEILSRVLAARENAKVMKAEKRHRVEEEVDDVSQQSPAVVSNTRQLLFIPAKVGGNFKLQFRRALEELVLPAEASGKDVQELPSVAYLITLDSRFAVQCVPWTLLDAIMEQAKLYTGSRNVLLLFVLTKVELVSAAALISQFSLLAAELNKRYPAKSIPKHIVMTFVPFSIYHDTLTKHLLRVLNQFKESEGGKSNKMKSNLSNKMCAFVIGLPNSGRRSLSRTLTQVQYQTSVGSAPLHAAQLHLTRTKEDKVETKFAIPNAKGVTLIQFPEDHTVQAALRTITGGDIFFRSLTFIEKCEEPEAIACAVF
ncbi:hypothetical protein STCU_08332 [Strigomonas culicis]|nr:hypothetical protein STCU_08332 [Strigomonas culicis]|eukprot:EPY22134.1 hypothetical protein STCU_08332 [Strigomonas culicis]